MAGEGPSMWTLLALLVVAASTCAASDHPHEDVALADYVEAEGAHATVASSYTHRVEACFQEKSRCGAFTFATDLAGLVLDATGQYVSSFTCCQPQDGSYNDREGGGNLFAPTSPAGYCIIDTRTIAPVSNALTEPLLGQSQVTCSISDASACGVEGCNNVGVVGGPLKTTVVNRAVSYTGDGKPAVCAVGPIDRIAPGQDGSLRGGGGINQARRQAASAADSTASVCVGPALLISGPVVIGSRRGPQRAGWFTYEVFLWQGVPGPAGTIVVGAANCTTVPADVSTLPVVRPGRITLAWDEDDGQERSAA